METVSEMLKRVEHEDLMRNPNYRKAYLSREAQLAVAKAKEELAHAVSRLTAIEAGFIWSQEELQDSSECDTL